MTLHYAREPRSQRPIGPRVCLLLLFILGIGCSSGRDSRGFKPSRSYATSDGAQVSESNLSLNTSTRSDHDVDNTLVKVREHIAQVRASHKKSSIDLSHRLESEIQKAGGLQTLLQKRLQTLSSRLEMLQRTNPPSAELSGLRQSVLRLKYLIPKFNPCQIPLLLSFGDVVVAAGQALPADEMNGYIEPEDDLVLFGCGFGAHPGSVNLKLSNSGQTLPLAFASYDWSSTAVEVTVPYIAGVLDQPAEITLTTSAKQASSMGVHFVAYRDTTWLDTYDHQNLVHVNPQCFTATTVDSCGGGDPNEGPYDGPFGNNFIGNHLKKCCKSHNGTDIYYVSLSNEWTSTSLDPYVDFPLVGTQYTDGGYVSCYFFSHPGHLTAAPQVVSGTAGVTFQVEFSWHVNGICSGESYAAAEALSGPIGFSYW